jgi:hypothetical protein
MSTRGAYGYYKSGVTKVAYNHFDSYPEGLGVDMVNYCKSFTLNEMEDVFNRLTDVEGRIFKKGDEVDWYKKLREFQGKPEKWHEVEGEILYEDCNDFLKDSLFCEYAYIINLDAYTLEVYTDRSDKAHSGRYEIKRVNSYPIETVTVEDMEKI